MIGRLRGRILKIVENMVLLDVAGIGYEVEVPRAGLLPQQGPPSVDSEGITRAAVRDPQPGSGPPQEPLIVLHVHMVVREDAQLLYGFLQESERNLFRLLIRINGVGPKMALAILATFVDGELARCVEDDNLAALTRVPGVGKKTAERLLVELRNRQELLPVPTGNAPAAVPMGARGVQGEVEQALIGLGYKPQHASQVVQAISEEHAGADTQTLLRAALQYLAKRSEVGP